MSAEQPFARVAVLGLGLMGGSLARSLAALEPRPRVLGWSPDEAEREAALGAGVLDEAPRGAEQTAAAADLVVLAAPLEASCRLLPLAACAAPRDATLTDVASLKVPLAGAAEAAGVEARWVGAHPMAGGTASGFGASRSDLYRGARVWTAAAGAAHDRVGAVHALWRALGARPRTIDASAHDRLMTLVSHVPQLLSVAVVGAMIEEGVSAADLGPAGRDLTRVAASSPRVWLDLFAHAPSDLSRALRDVAARTSELAELVERGDHEGLEAIGRMMRAAGAWRGDA